MEPNPYKSPPQDSVPQRPPSFWTGAFQRGLLVAVFGFAFVEAMIIVGRNHSRDVRIPGTFKTVSEIAVVVFAAGAVSTFIASIAWVIDWLRRDHAQRERSHTDD